MNILKKTGLFDTNSVSFHRNKMVNFSVLKYQKYVIWLYGRWQYDEK